MTLVQTVAIPANRKLVLELTVPDDIPLGKAEIFVSMKPVTPAATPQHTFENYIGALSGSAAFVGDAVQIQRVMRDEW